MAARRANRTATAWQTRPQRGQRKHAAKRRGGAGHGGEGGLSPPGMRVDAACRIAPSRPQTRPLNCKPPPQGTLTAATRSATPARATKRPSAGACMLCHDKALVNQRARSNSNSRTHNTAKPLRPQTPTLPPRSYDPVQNFMVRSRRVAAARGMPEAAPHSMGALQQHTRLPAGSTLHLAGRAMLLVLFAWHLCIALPD